MKKSTEKTIKVIYDLLMDTLNDSGVRREILLEFPNGNRVVYYYMRFNCFKAYLKDSKGDIEIKNGKLLKKIHAMVMEYFEEESRRRKNNSRNERRRSKTRENKAARTEDKLLALIS